jgi:hypothetical protein
VCARPVQPSLIGAGSRHLISFHRQARSHLDSTAGSLCLGRSTTASPHPLIAARRPRFVRGLGHGRSSKPDRSPFGSAPGRGGVHASLDGRGLHPTDEETLSGAGHGAGYDRRPRWPIRAKSPDPHCSPVRLRPASSLVNNALRPWSSLRTSLVFTCFAHPFFPFCPDQEKEKGPAPSFDRAGTVPCFCRLTPPRTQTGWLGSGRSLTTFDPRPAQQHQTRSGGEHERGRFGNTRLTAERADVAPLVGLVQVGRP